MASIRLHAHIARSADDVWKEITDPTALTAWFPDVTDCTLRDDVRTVYKADVSVDEQIVTNDTRLRRLQYRVLPGQGPVESHLATVDVIESGDGSIVIYATDVTPDAVAAWIEEILAAAVEGLKKYLESA